MLAGRCGAHVTVLCGHVASCIYLATGGNYSSLVWCSLKTKLQLRALKALLDNRNTLTVVRVSTNSIFSKFPDSSGFSMIIKSQLHDHRVCVENSVHWKQTLEWQKKQNIMYSYKISKRIYRDPSKCSERVMVKVEKKCISGQNNTSEPGREQVGSLMFGITRNQTHKLKLTTN